MTKPDLHGDEGKGWIGVDLDGTLAYYDGWKGSTHIGAPIPRMLERVRGWLAEGRTVKIMTARVAPGKGDEDECRAAIGEWLSHHGLAGLEVTHAKDHRMVELWDDRVVQVVPNTGERADRNPSLERIRSKVSYYRDWGFSRGSSCRVAFLADGKMALYVRLTDFYNAIEHIALGINLAIAGEQIKNDPACQQPPIKKAPDNIQELIQPSQALAEEMLNKK